MHPDIERRLEDVKQVCRVHNVDRLDLFGSAVTNAFDAGRSDFDFLVTFQAMTPSAHTDAFFGLKEDLERTLARPVDLLEFGPIQNPYFLKEIEKTRIQVYAA